MLLDGHALASLRSIRDRAEAISTLATTTAATFEKRSFFGHVERAAWRQAHGPINGAFPETNLIGRHLMDVAEQVEALQPGHAELATRLRRDAGAMVADGDPGAFSQLPVVDTHFLQRMTPRADAARAAQLINATRRVQADVAEAIMLLEQRGSAARANHLFEQAREAIATGRPVDPNARMALAAMDVGEVADLPARRVLDTLGETLESSTVDPGRGWQYRGMLRLLRDVLPTSAADHPMAGDLARSIDESAARNIAYSLDEVAHAGYQGHPDYAEVGQLAARTRLLAALDQAPAPVGDDMVAW